MPRATRLLILCLLSSLVGFTSCQRRPEPRRELVPVPHELTKRCAWPDDAPLSQVFEVARVRKACLVQYEGQLEAIEQLQP